MSANVKKWLKWIGLAILLYIIYRIISNRLDAPKKPTVPVVTAGGGTTPVQASFKYDPAKVDRNRVFGVGSNNSQEVGYLQTWLNKWRSAGLNVDGDWGAKTSLAFTAHLAGNNPLSTTLNNITLDGKPI